MNNPQRVDVERLRHLAQEMLLVWNEDWIDELAEALPALLQQLAEREAEIERERSRREHTQQWYAERLVKIEEIAKREGLWNEVAAVIANGSGTRQLPDGSYFYDPPTYAQQLNSAKHRAEAAERAREEACEELATLQVIHNCLRRDHDRSKAQAKAAREIAEQWNADARAEGFGGGSVKGREIIEAMEAAFLAASGGSSNG